MNTNHAVDIQGPDKPTKNAKRINMVIAASLVVIAIGVGVFLSWGFQSTDVLSVNKLPIPTRTIRDHPTAGGVVILNIDYCKKMDVEGNLRISYVSSTREVFLPLTKERAPKGCQKTEVPVLIPKDLPPDTYEIKLRATYDVNPLKKNITDEFKSSSFVVDPQ
jgi:hypothetical protein